MAQIKKKVTILKKQEQKKPTWWIWGLAGLVAIVAVIFLILKSTPDNTNIVLSEKIELAASKANDIATELKDSTVNLAELQSKVGEAQNVIDEASRIAKSDVDKQAIAEIQAKVNEANQAVQQKKASAESKIPTSDPAIVPANNETVANKVVEQPATASSSETSNPAQSSSEKPVTAPVKGGQSGTSQTVSSITSVPSLPQGSLEEKAKRVIRGDFGNGIERKQTLGSEYDTIQQKVNEMYRNGEVI